MSGAQNDNAFAASIHDLVKLRNAKAAPKADAKDEIERLSRLDGLDLELELEGSSKRLNIPAGRLRKLVEKARKQCEAAEAAATPLRVEEPPPAAGKVQWPRGFTMTEDGLFAQPSEQVPAVWVCSRFEMLGEARNPQGEGWSKWLRWCDADGRAHEMPVEARLLHLTNGDLEARLADRGLRISADPKTRGLLRQALAGARSGTRATLIPQPGWAALEDGSRGYVLPNGDTVGEPGETLILHPAPENGRNLSGVAGSLEGWKREVAENAVGNAPVLFCVSMAFAGPLLEIVGEVSGGFHFVGGSKTGKSLKARLAVSVWGLPFEEGAFRSWNTTVNAMETTAEASNDGLLMLDEIHQAAAPDKVVKAIYAIANQAGKDRMTKDAMGRPRRSWQTIVLSTGEKDVAAVAAEANLRVPAGADVRMPCIRTEAHNTWPELHGHGGLDKLAAALCAAMRRHYGTAGRAFVERLARLDAAGREDLLCELNVKREWMLGQLPAGACAQVRDVARRFALVAFAGELATEWGILPWEDGNAEVAARSMMRRWLEARGGVGSSEESQTLQTIRAFLLTEGPSRFVAIGKDDKDRWVETFPGRPVPNRAGWRRPDKDKNDREEYLIAFEVWEAECKRLRLDPDAAARTLQEKGHLKPGEGKHRAPKETIPGIGRRRVYCIKSSIFDDNPGAGGGA